MDFAQLGLIPPILAAVAEAGYEQPTPIQKAAIPTVLAGQDLLGLAQTGTGKTAAFALPIIQRLVSTQAKPSGAVRPIRCLVLTPTRELAAQIGENFRIYGKHLSLRSAVIFGGVGIEPQKQTLARGIDVLIATPGRLLDLASQRALDLRHLDIFVLDEADRMLDMGFIHDVRRVIALLPPRRQTLFFSATMPPEAKELADALLHKPQTVAVTPVSSTVDRIEQCVYFVDKSKKRALLAAMLGNPDLQRVLVFARMKHAANRTAEYLEKQGFVAAAIHGNKSQSARERALQGFKDGTVRVLVATDIAARGIDIDDVTHVFNFDLPEVPETYVHRIGRTARAGRDGVAIAFCDQEERDLLRGIERLTRKQVPVATWDGPLAAEGPEQRAPRQFQRRVPPPTPQRGRQHAAGRQVHGGGQGGAGGASGGHPAQAHGGGGGAGGAGGEARQGNRRRRRR